METWTKRTFRERNISLRNASKGKDLKAKENRDRSVDICIERVRKPRVVHNSIGYFLPNINEHTNANVLRSSSLVRSPQLLWRFATSRCSLFIVLTTPSTQRRNKFRKILSDNIEYRRSIPKILLDRSRLN